MIIIKHYPNKQGNNRKKKTKITATKQTKTTNNANEYNQEEA